MLLFLSVVLVSCLSIKSQKLMLKRFLAKKLITYARQKYFFGKRSITSIEQVSTRIVKFMFLQQDK